MISVELMWHLRHPKENRLRRYKGSSDPCYSATRKRVPKLGALWPLGCYHGRGLGLLNAMSDMTLTTLPVFQTRFNLSKHNDKKAETALRRRLLPFWWAFILIDASMFLALYVVAVWLFQEFGIGALVFIVGLIIFRQIAVMGMKLYQSRIIALARRSTPVRHGERTVSFSHEMIQIEHAGFSQTLRWSHALDVIDTKAGLLIVYGGMDALVIPSDAMPEGQSQTDLKVQIESWIGAAKSAN